MSEESLADKKFPSDITSRERAIFEVGIKLGALYHIAMGLPISKDPTTITSIETALANSIKTQPYVTDVKVAINLKKVKGTKSHQFDYSQINSSLLEATIHLKYKDIAVTGVIEWNEDLNYPLMFIKEIQ
ncbi:MAG: dihydroneopterin aldolase [Promethearchaeota archaeon]|nr:MAG: dihydroneopterin aldolase [Candidatus Lokiarchaeota archaeon]